MFELANCAVYSVWSVKTKTSEENEQWCFANKSWIISHFSFCLLSFSTRCNLQECGNSFDLPSYQVDFRNHHKFTSLDKRFGRWHLHLPAVACMVSIPSGIPADRSQVQNPASATLVVCLLLNLVLIFSNSFDVKKTWPGTLCIFQGIFLSNARKSVLLTKQLVE